MAAGTYPQSCVLIRRVTKRPKARSSHRAPIHRCTHAMGTIGRTVSSVSAPSGAIPAATAPTRCAQTVGTSMQSGTNFRPALLASFVLHLSYVCMDSPSTAGESTVLWFPPTRSSSTLASGRIRVFGGFFERGGSSHHGVREAGPFAQAPLAVPALSAWLLRGRRADIRLKRCRA